MEPQTILSISTLLAACATSPVGEAPWNQLYRLEASRVRLGVIAALARCGERCDPELVDDLVQEVWCRLLVQCGRRSAAYHGDNDGMARRYLRRVAQGVVVDALRAGGARKRRPRGMVSLADLAEADWLPTDTRGCPERRLLARERLACLLELCRRVIGSKQRPVRLRIARLALVEGWTSNEIAEHLGGSWSERAIDSIVFRIRRRLTEEGMRLPRRPGGRGVLARRR
jgi:RNA polymerase sigma factor (sigma-70 family)